MATDDRSESEKGLAIRVGVGLAERCGVGPAIAMLIPSIGIGLASHLDHLD